MGADLAMSPMEHTASAWELWMAQMPQTSEQWGRYVEETAMTMGVSISPGDLPAVVAIFANLARVAQPLMAFALPEAIEAAPLFTARSDPL
jgi:Protein of unknown function (DUF4089)